MVEDYVNKNWKERKQNIRARIFWIALVLCNAINVLYLLQSVPSLVLCPGLFFTLNLGIK